MNIGVLWTPRSYKARFGTRPAASQLTNVTHMGKVYVGVILDSCHGTPPGSITITSKEVSGNVLKKTVAGSTRETGYKNTDAVHAMATQALGAAHQFSFSAKPAEEDGSTFEVGVKLKGAPKAKAKSSAEAGSPSSSSSTDGPGYVGDWLRIQKARGRQAKRQVRLFMFRIY